MKNLFEAAQHCQLAIERDGFTDVLTGSYYRYEAVPMEFYLALPEFWPVPWLIKLAELVHAKPHMRRSGALLLSIYSEAEEDNAEEVDLYAPTQGEFYSTTTAPAPATLEERLEAALRREDYEEAARLRDEIGKKINDRQWRG